MGAQTIQYATGLQIINFTDTYGRETEVCIGYSDIMITHKAQDGSTESMRRYSKQEIDIIFEALSNML